MAARAPLSLLWFGLQFLAVLALGASSEAKESVVRVDLRAAPEAGARLLREHDLDVLALGQGWVDLLVDEDEKATILALGLPLSTRIDDARAFERTLRERGYFSHFHDYGEILAEISQIASQYPQLVVLYDIGDSWETTQGLAERHIWAVKVSDNVALDEPEEAEVVIMANLHAREIITPEIALSLLRHLVELYGVDPRVTELVNGRQIWIIPSCNPDGLDYVHSTNMWWRKNRRNNGDGTFGVDLNRNWGYQWGYDDIGSSPSTWSETYRGSGPFSEPETAALRDFFEAHHVVISLSFHSYGNWWLYPRGYVPEDTPDHPTFVALAESCVAYNGYLPGNAASGIIYLTNGDSDDWLYGEQTTKHKTFAFSPECGGPDDGFHPDTTRIEALVQENLGPCLYVIEAAERYAPRPVIAHAPLPDTEDLIGPYLVAARITPTVWPLDPSTFTLHSRFEGADWVQIPLVPTSPDSFAAWLPGPGESGTVSYYLSASDIIPRTAFLPPQAPDSLFSFRVGLDSVPPAIVHVPLGDHPPQTRPFPVSATVTDNVGVDSVWVEYAVNGGPLAAGPLLPQGGDLYLGFIDPPPVSVGDSIAYRLVARDEAVAHNVATHPAQGFHRFAVTEGYSFDFEASDGGFRQTSGSAWQWGRPTTGPMGAHSGQNVWATNLAGYYADNANATLDTPPLVLVNATEATLTFWHWYRMEYSDNVFWDGGNVKISTDGGSSFQLLFPEGGYDGVVTNPANGLWESRCSGVRLRRGASGRRSPSTSRTTSTVP